MTDSPYGNYQTPSSRPPEPPYRAGSDYGQPVGNRFEEQRSEPQTSDAASKDTSGVDVSGYAPGDSYRYASDGERTESFTEVHYGDTKAMAAADAPYEPHHANAGETPPAHQATQAAPPSRKQASGAKTFLFGFLGALVACVVALGGYSLLNGNSATANTASTVVGTSDSSVIDAVEEGQTLSEAVAAKALPSVVAVYNYQEQSSSGYGYGSNGSSNGGSLSAAGMGSGVVISDDGYILTNYHVVEDADKLTVTVNDEERDATYVGGDESSDVAVLKVDNTDGLVAADIGDSDNLVIGEWVMTVGAPLGLEQSVATGVVSATNRSTIMDNSSSNGNTLFYQNTNPSYTYYPNMIQTDAVINPGNSGGALVDADGKLIGINTMISSYSGDYAGVGFAIPVNYAIGIAEQVIQGKDPSHAMLGVSISQVNQNIAQRYGLSTDTGAYISSITEGTGAADSGLQVGDIITQVDDTKVTSTTDVTLEVREHNPGDTVKVTVNRNGQTEEFDVVLSSDENVSTSTEESQGQNGNGQGNGYGYGNGNGYGYGNGNGYNNQNIEDLLKLFGM